MSVKLLLGQKNSLGETYLRRRKDNKITNAKFRIGTALYLLKKLSLDIMMLPKNYWNEGGRLLFTGSILSKSKAGDFYGIGAKSENININHPLNIILRGPLTYELLKKRDSICQI